MLVKPRKVLDRDDEWVALDRFVSRHQRLALVYGPRRVGKSYLLEALCHAAGGHRYQAIAGLPAVQLTDFGRVLGDWLGAGPLRLTDWNDGFERLSRLKMPVVAIDEFPYLVEASPELATIVQRYVDAPDGPRLVLAGSAMSTMAELATARAPLFGRSSAVVVPRAFEGADLARLWALRDPLAALWVNAAVGGLPGYRSMLEPPGRDLDAWMHDEVLASSSPLLDAAEATLADVTPSTNRAVLHTILTAIAQGERTFSAIARVAGRPTGALTRPLGLLERGGLVVRVHDPLRARRDLYDLADPYLRMWLAIIAPNRSALQAGRASRVWAGVRQTTWRAQVLGPRWEEVARSYVARSAEELVGPVDVVGATTVSDRARRTSLEVDLVAVRAGKIVAVGEAKLRALGPSDLERLIVVRETLGAPGAKLVLASAEKVDPSVARRADVIAVTPRDVYR